MRNTALFISIVLALALMVSACADQVADPDVGPHPANFESPALHGQVVIESPNDAQSCTTCHGDDFHGGTSGVSCYECHDSYPHSEGFAEPAHEDFHEHFIVEERAWHIETCSGCHGEDFAGKGVAEKNCTTCHEGGPTSCDTCHGSDQNIAPPVDLENHTEPTFMGVGVHQAHVGEMNATDLPGPSCQHCHPPVEGFLDDSHLDEIQAVDGAEIEFSALASAFGATPTWDRASGTCSDVYCHGAFSFLQENSENPWGYAEAVILGQNPLTNWTEPEAQPLVCGSCHGLPPTGHIQTSPRVTVDDCSQCHGRVVNARYQIIDKDLHINGEIELF